MTVAATNAMCLSLVGLLFGCASKLTTTDLGAAHIAVLSVTPWDEVRSDLQPRFPMTAELALQQAIATTQASDQKQIDSKSTSISVAFPATESVETQPANLPAGVSTSPTRSALPTNLGSNAMMEYWAATALYQEVQIINRYIHDAALYPGYEPFLVRLQVSVMPAARGLPYDVYSTLSFFPSRLKDGTDWVHPLFDPDFGNLGLPTEDDETNTPAAKLAALQTINNFSNATRPLPTRQVSVSGNPLVIPLVVTDSLEQAIRARSDEAIRALALGFQATFQGVGAGIDHSEYLRLLRELYGREDNSLLTVARVSENTIRVRLGAPHQVQLDSPSSHAMIPRTHNVSVLVLMPLELLRETVPGEEVDLSVMWTNEMVHAKTGTPAQPRSDLEFVVGVHEAVHDWTWDCDSFAIKWNGRSGVSHNPAALRKGAIKRRAVKLAKLVLLDDFAGFGREINEMNLAFGGDNCLAVDESAPEAGNAGKSLDALSSRVTAMWHQLSDQKIKIRAGVMRFGLPKIFDSSIASKREGGIETALLIDDGKQSIMRLQWVGWKLVPDRVRLELHLPDGRMIPSNSISIEDDGRSVQAQFISLSAYDAHPAPDVSFSGTLYYTTRTRESREADGEPDVDKVDIHDIAYIRPKAAAKTMYPIALRAPGAVVATSGEASIELEAATVKSVIGADRIKSGWFKIANGTVTAAVALEDGNPVAAAAGWYEIKVNKKYRIDLSGLNSQAPIEIQLQMADASGKRVNVGSIHRVLVDYR